MVQGVSFCYRGDCAEVSTAEQAASPVTVQQWCRPLYGKQSPDKKHPFI